MGVDEKQQHSMKGVEGMVEPMSSIEVGGCIIYHGSFLMYAMTETGVDGTGERLIWPITPIYRY
jgi:hypothetical protein